MSASTKFKQRVYYIIGIALLLTVTAISILPSYSNSRLLDIIRPHRSAVIASDNQSDAKPIVVASTGPIIDNAHDFGEEDGGVTVPTAAFIEDEHDSDDASSTVTPVDDFEEHGKGDSSLNALTIDTDEDDHDQSDELLADNGMVAVEDEEEDNGNEYETLIESTIAIVVATTVDQDTDWITEYFPDWLSYIYSVDDPNAGLQVANRGREGSAYLTYIIDHYDGTGSDSQLADYVVFHHPDQYQWHNDGPDTDAVFLLQSFNFSSVDEDGYVNLRCDQEPGCDEETSKEPTTIWHDDVGGIQWNTLFGRALAELRPWAYGPESIYPEVVAAPCCAQFVVSRERILTVPKKKYEQYRDFLYDWHFRKTVPELEGDFILGNNMSTSDSEGAISGGLMEFMWHIIFGRPAVDCMVMEHCYCRNFGWCENKDLSWKYEEIEYY